MKKGNFTQSVTSFKNKSKNIQPVVIETDLVNSLIGNEETKAPSVAAVNAGLKEKITEEQAKAITEDIIKNIKVELADTLEGNEEDKAPNVKAVNEGLDGKLDVPSFSGEQLVRYNVMTGMVAGLPFNNAAQAYAVPVRDANGNFKVGTPQADGDVTSKKYVDDGLAGKIDKVSMKSGVYAYIVDRNGQGTMQITNSPNRYTIPMTDENGNTKTNTPVNDLDAANKKYVDAGLEGRVPTTEYQYKLYGTRGLNAETGKVNQSYHSMAPVGMTTGDVVQWVLATNTVFNGKEPTSTIGACDPIKPIQVANKRYVDNKVSELEHGVMNALGAQYIMVEVKDFGASIPIPSGAMKFAYIESLGVIKGYDNDGNELGVAEVDAINVGDTEHSIDDLPKYIEIPEGTQTITLSITPPEGTVYTKGTDGKIVFQVKVGA